MSSLRLTGSQNQVPGGDFQKRMSPEPLNSYSTVVYSEVDVDFQCILGIQSQSIDFTDSFSQVDIPSGDPVFIEIPRYFVMLLSGLKKPIWSR